MRGRNESASASFSGLVLPTSKEPIFYRGASEARHGAVVLRRKSGPFSGLRQFRHTARTDVGHRGRLFPSCMAVQARHDAPDSSDWTSPRHETESQRRDDPELLWYARKPLCAADCLPTGLQHHLQAGIGP